MTTELAIIETLTPHELFKPGTLDPVLGRIREEVLREAATLDISTEPNRRALNSLAFKVTKSKTFIEAQRKNLVAGEKERLKAIDKEGGRIWDELENLAAEVRKPLTDWENAEKDRVAKHEAALKELVDVGNICELNWNNPSWSAGLGRSRLDAIMASTYDWQEFHQRAIATVSVTIRQIKESIAKREKWDAEQEELSRLRTEQAARQQAERDASIAKAAADKAKADAERVAQVAARTAQEAQERVEREKLEAEAKAKQAEAQKIAAEEKAKRDSKEAAERLEQEKARAETARLAAIKTAEDREKAALAKAELDKQAAIEAERQRAEKAKREEDAAIAKREADKKHSAKINREVRDAFMANGATEEISTTLVNLIASGKIPHTKIVY